MTTFAVYSLDYTGETTLFTGATGPVRYTMVRDDGLVFSPSSVGSGVLITLPDGTNTDLALVAESVLPASSQSCGVLYNFAQKGRYSLKGEITVDGTVIKLLTLLDVGDVSTTYAVGSVQYDTRSLLKDLTSNPPVWSDDEINQFLRISTPTRNPLMGNPYIAAAEAYENEAAFQARSAVMKKIAIFTTDKRGLPAQLRAAAADFRLKACFYINPADPTNIYGGAYVTTSVQVFTSHGNAQPKGDWSR